jgi:hypothetical protein
MARVGEGLSLLALSESMVKKYTTKRGENDKIQNGQFKN